MGRGERGGRARAAARRPRLHEPRAARRARSGPRRGARSPSRRTARSSSTRCAGGPDLGAWGAEALAGARRDVRRLGATSATCSSEVCGPVARVHEVPPGVDIELWRPEEREAALAALLDEARRDAPNPGNAEERLPDDGNAARLASFLARRPADRRLLRQADRAEGRARAARRAARRRRARRRRRLRAGARGARGARRGRRRPRALHRPARAPAPAAPARASRTRASCRPSSPRRSGWSRPRRRPPAARPSCRGTRGWRRSRRSSRRRCRPRSGRSSRSRRRRRRTARAAHAGCSRLPAADRASAAGDGAAGRRGALELGRDRAAPARAGDVAAARYRKGSVV